MKGFLKEILITLGLAIAIYVVLLTVIQNSEVYDVSMQPTLVEGQRVIVVKAAYHFTDPERGDIITLHPPFQSQKQYVKRLIGLPGDIVEIKNGIVYVNNIPLDEPYIESRPTYYMAPVTVPENHYFVLGDNRNNSYDSHSGWTVTREEIVGKAWLRIWPLNKFGGVGNYSLNNQVQSARMYELTELAALE